MKHEHPFTGFYKETFVFLRSLETNNNKKWFEQHKNDYHEFLLNPLKSLVSDLSGFMLTIDPFFEVSPAVNRTISRIYRDTRFTKDKSPYKTTSWIIFKRPKKDWKNSPAYFIELSPDSYRFGMGFYSASPNTMRLFREAIARSRWSVSPMAIMSFWLPQIGDKGAIQPGTIICGQILWQSLNLAAILGPTQHER